MTDIPLSILTLVERGYHHKEVPLEISVAERREYEQKRCLARRWRNLIGELKYDIPRDMWQFVNMSMPKEWHIYRHLNNIRSHDFVIELPNFLPVTMVYRQHGSDWCFDKFEIISQLGTTLSSNKYEELSLFLAIAHDLGRRKTKHKVEIEEIQVGGDLENNANVVKQNLPVLTMEDFIGPQPKDTADEYGWRKHEFANMGGA